MNMGILGLAGILLLTGCGSPVSDNQSIQDQTQKASDELAEEYFVEPTWYPSGFSEFSGDTEYSKNLAWRWGTSAETVCPNDSRSCWSVILVSKSGCPGGLQSDIKMYDSFNNEIESTRKSYWSEISPMQPVNFIFESSFVERAHSAQIFNLVCYPS